MLRPAALGLLLACAASFGGSATVLEDGVPVGWARAAGTVAQLPTRGETVTPDPWNLPNRASLYRLLIGATDPFMGSMGPNATESPLWGLSLQLGWMATSGRLADPTRSTTCGLNTGDTTCISTESWWACVNYFVSVLPFLSASQQGFMGPGVQVQMEKPEGVEEFCTAYADCAARYPDAMSKWDAFFQGLKAANQSPQSDKEKKDSILGLYWAAQMASLDASAACKARQSHYPSKEVTFANSWMSTAGYVAAARFHSSLGKSAPFISPLPSLVLNDTVVLSSEELHTLNTFSWLKVMNFILGGRLMHLWEAAMCTVETREKGREMLEELLLNPSFPTNTLISLISEMRKGC
ncbi:protein LEG1 homolog [Betta splendens]|uniref:Protein LEG1 homolog n=1 Tax=Betta splendens TaxID=158456 RepID=A0A6P7LT63_BETSP|nr:protein LEG1 homolog [Betta splendens]